MTRLLGKITLFLRLCFSTSIFQEHFSTLSNEAKWLLRCRYISLASNAWRGCTDLDTVEFSIVFKLCRYRLNASSNFSTVTFFRCFQIVLASCER